MKHVLTIAKRLNLFLLEMFIQSVGSVLGSVEIDTGVQIGFYIIVNPFLKLGRIQFDYTRSCQIGFILNASNPIFAITKNP